MKILFSALHFAHFRNFESVVRELAARGHQIHLAADEAETFGGRELVERLAAEHPGITWGWTPDVTREPWSASAQKVRSALEYVRFLDPRYERSQKLRLRNRDLAPRVVRWLTAPVAGMRPGRSATAAGLRWLEHRMPRSTEVERWIAERAPDVILLTSLTVSRSTHLEQLKAARVAGIPVAATVMSWDHLSSKAPLHIAPDLVLVWNDVQRREAVEMHGIASERVAVTGAQCYDQWFTRQPAQSREEFCRARGLAPDRPFVLYVCSTMSPVPDPVEPVFVKTWVEALRASADPVLRNAGVLIRRHPERVKDWAGISLDAIDHVVLSGRNPIDSEAKTEYFDSLYHSAAVVGLCTSAFLEAGIVGRPVLAPLLPQYRIHQEEMAHFRYLLDVEGGLLITGTGMDAHLGQLSAALSAPPGRDERNRRFLTTFVRPSGLDCPATPMFVESVERLSTTRRQAGDAGLEGSRAARALVGRMVAAANAGFGQWLLMDAIDKQRAQSERDGERYKNALIQGRTEYREAKRLKREAAIRAGEEERRAKERKKRLRGLNARKQIAKLKGGVKRLIGLHP